MAEFLPRELEWERCLGWWAEEIAEWESHTEERLPLVDLSAEGVLDFEGRMALLIAGLVEEDSRFGSVIASLQLPEGQRRPCVETVVAMAPLADGPPAVDLWELSSALFRAGLVEVGDAGAPRPEWVLKVPSYLWEVLRGQRDPAPAPWFRFAPAGSLRSPDELIVSAEIRSRLMPLRDLLEAGDAGNVVIRGMRGSDRRAIAGSLARSLGRGALFVDAAALDEDAGLRRLGPLATALGAMPVVTYDLDPGQTAPPLELVGYSGPVVYVLGLEGGVDGDAVARSVVVEVPHAPADIRRRQWEAALDGRELRDPDEVSERLLLPTAHIRRAAAIAGRIAALDGRDEVELADVREACRALSRHSLDTLATRLEPTGSWDQLVVGDIVAAKLHELERRCRYRERILGHLADAFSSGANRGVRALLTGSSGTGKTLAARILASELGMDVYRVDLSAVVDKYVGQTEKNLHRVLSRAEELDVVLLIDEGDSLLGARTDVKSANDRFANLETNYLLQRLETYQGIVLVTTNAADHIDPAFQRRMDVVVNFVEPGPLERQHIWQIHLPEHHEVPAEVLREVSERCSMTGGQVRNAALHATLLALDERVAVAERHVRRSIEAEYGKAGAVSPFDPAGREPRPGGVQAFLEAVT